MERRPYGIRIIMPVLPSEGTLLDILLRIPSKAYLLPKEEGIVLDFQSRVCSSVFLVRLMQKLIWGKRVRVLAWISTNAETLSLFRSFGLSVEEPHQPIEGKSLTTPVVSPPKAPEVSLRNPVMLKLICTSLRGGQTIEAPGDVILWGHLNPGAEIIAGGNVVVAGRLRGLVHAGQVSNAETPESNASDIFILAGSFESPQIRIGNKLCYPDASTYGWGESVLITLEDGKPTIRVNSLLKESAGKRKHR
ncbi:MAG: hypothetical protein K6E38_04315 [Fretibacterium sp.]|nr:hypothetical protein [Fretibacterium sp.]